MDNILSKDQKIEYNARVEDIMSRKIIGVKPTDTLKHVLEILIREGYKRLPVVDENYNLLGVVTDKDLRSYSKSIFEHDLKDILDSLESYQVKDILVDPMLYKKAHHGERVIQCAKEMLVHQINGMPVVDEDGKLEGIVTRSDLLDQLIRILEPLNIKNNKEKVE
ncbi:hypothetical protein DICPUDRAFT_53982 [Dictyostelium purpureum]|uniref:CBS domain-containing protein n=1 Tax=Dictyostelium purpureum TaxID=5786 RepID=F0ZF37_DICPU|nr:uncharacterized protein DICPUDRAFT_53982 [Dictyostelium purpureum]EGC37469.1 hypothetical protein DICPUDRAFT_53982 [Dictyostelium purpureum]|eukprot:XP_003286033.1 hypothetical protein DICPUDRAFT_53982 [Dictyostelium purpureum]